ncbi:MAG: hypothetical protein ACI8QC_000125 [Planctomycetota bacterium]|jgi:hypothetical protein
MAANPKKTSSMRFFPTSLLALVVCVLVGLTSSCHIFYTRITPQWQEAELECSSAKAMFELSALALKKAGFTIGDGSDPAKSTLRSGWATSTSPFKSRGYRDKASVVFENLRPGWFVMKVRVERETNESFRPLEPEHANWEEAQDNPDAAMRVIQFARSILAAAG